MTITTRPFYLHTYTWPTGQPRGGFPPPGRHQSKRMRVSFSSPGTVPGKQGAKTTFVVTPLYGRLRGRGGVFLTVGS